MRIFPALFHPDLFNVIPTAFDRLLMHKLLILRKNVDTKYDTKYNGGR